MSKVRRSGNEESQSSSNFDETSSTNLHILQKTETDVEDGQLLTTNPDPIEKNEPLDSDNSTTKETKTGNDSVVSRKGLYVLALLAFQNSGKNLLMRFVMIDKPDFLLSTAVIVVELLKLVFSAAFVIFYQKDSVSSIYKFIFKDDRRNSLLLAVPASCYIVQMTLEYIAFANIDPASFSVLVQMKVLFTALFFKIVLGKKLKKKQMLSLIILTVGVMLCNLSKKDDSSEVAGDKFTGILATFGIAVSSGFASVYTEKVIKSASAQSSTKTKEQYSLAHMQCQLAVVSLFILGFYALIQDSEAILKGGFFQNFNGPAFFSCLNSSVGGLIVATVLKYADSVLKGYATAVSVVLTGVLSSHLFGTDLSMLFGMGMINVVVSVLLYNSSGLDDYLC